MQENSEAKLSLEYFGDPEAMRLMMDSLEVEFLKKAEDCEDYRDLLLDLAQEAADRNVI